MEDSSKKGSVTRNNASIRCDKHTKKFIKFYCSRHDQVGCDDCMILHHKPCRIELIPDTVNDYRDSELFKHLTRDVDEINSEATKMLTYIKTSRDQIKIINSKFKRDVTFFKDQLMAHITNLANAMLKLGDDIMAEDMKVIEQLEKENTSLLTETATLGDTLRSLSDQPFKDLIQHKKRLQQLQHELENIRINNNANTYVFERDSDMERFVKDRKQLGHLRNNTQKSKKETSTMTSLPWFKRQVYSLLDGESKNLEIDGVQISYGGNESSGDIGSFVRRKQYVGLTETFEIEILSLDKRGSIAIGVVPKNNPEKGLPGYVTNSIGYHSDGKLYEKGKFIRSIRAWQAGDRVRCRRFIDDHKTMIGFTHNGKWAGEFVLPRKSHRFALGMKPCKDKVKVL